MAIRTSRWTRSPRGRIFGVVTGLAEWRGLNPDMLRTIVFIITIFSGIVPGAIIYLILSLILPEQSEDDIVCTDDWRRTEARYTRRSNFNRRDAEDVQYKEKSDEDLNKEYENLKRKVESMENDIFDKEKDWDNRFKNN